jgi:magnesium transporter
LIDLVAADDDGRVIPAGPAPGDLLRNSLSSPPPLLLSFGSPQDARKRLEDGMQIVAFDFANKQERTLGEADWPARAEAGIFYWITAAPNEQSKLQDLLGKIDVNPVTATLLQGPQAEAHYELYEDAIHFTLADLRIEDKTLKSEVLAFLLGDHFLVALVSSSSPVMDKIQRIYREDFRKFARSSGFLLYELGSHLLESYRRIFQYFTGETERVQLRLFGKITDDIFAEVAELTGDILSFRRTVLSARDLFNELAMRKSAFVSETTQPALDILSDRMERLGGDIAGARSVLNETLNLYMGMVSHRTNRIVNRLTIFSMIFLPLSFLAGVYGMNFDVLPELRWPHAYLVFWIVVVVFVVAFVTFVRKKKWI